MRYSLEMKKTGILNADLARAIAALGHGDILVIGDAGLPVPAGVPCIDLAVTRGVPRFWEVLDAVLGDMVVERAVVATEATALMEEFGARLSPDIISHEALKALSCEAKAVVRTGEATPYANVALVAGVAF